MELSQAWSATQALPWGHGLNQEWSRPMQQKEDLPAPIKCLRMPEVISRVGYRELALRLMVIKGEFPKPFKLGGRAIAWLEHDVDEWIRARAATRTVTFIPSKQKGD